MMDKEKAIEEVNFIKQLLEDTNQEIIKNGWAFIWVGFVAFITFVFFGCLVTFRNNGSADLVNGTIIVGVEVIEIIIGILIYRHTIFKWSSVALEKQIWQIWIWALIITFFVSGVTITRTAHQLTVGLTSLSPDKMITAFLVALAASGILTNKSFFYKLIAVIVVLNWLFKFLPEPWQYLSLISGSINILLPLWGTGFYFLYQKQQTQSSRKGFTNGLE